MNILVNAIPFNNLTTGISRSLRNLYREVERGSEHSVTYCCGRHVYNSMMPPPEPAGWIKKTDAVWKLPNACVFTLRSLHQLSYEWFLKRVCKKKKYDIYHETGFVPPPIKNATVVYTIYDLSLNTLRDTHPKERVWFYNFFLARGLKQTDHIITISDFIKQEVCDKLKITSEHISVVHLASDPVFYRREDTWVKKTLTRLNIPQEYMLFVGSIEPRKNIKLIIKALKLMKNRLPLVLAGWSGWGEKAWLEEVKREGLADRIIITGYIDDETIACLYTGASVFLYPSLYEGFGLPVLEAMACGCPVVCSNAASLPEVAGNAALFTDPHSEDQLAALVDRLLEDSALRTDMIKRGYARNAHFTWQKSAQAMIDVFKKTSTAGII